MNTRKVDEFLKRLKRRETFLENRIGDAQEEKSHYDRAELYALNWMIAYVEDTILAAAEHQETYFKMRGWTK